MPVSTPSGHDNSFDLLRVLAALAVIGFHCGPLERGREPWGWGDLNLGALGVGTFFVISGFLVMGSLGRSASLGAYFARRIARIGPGLIVSVIVTAMMIGAFATTLPLTDYLTDSGPYLYALKNALLLPGGSVLPGVFEQNPLPNVVNGSLWTLRIEVALYVLLAALGACKVLTPRGAGALALGLAAATLAAKFAGPHVVPVHTALTAQVGLENAFLFFAGAWLALVERPKRRWAFASALLLLTPVWMLGLPLLVVEAGRTRSVKLPADISYGLYIYAFPVQQWLASQGRLSFWSAVALTLPFAVASWYLVERPALTLIHRTGGRFHRFSRSPAF